MNKKLHIINGISLYCWDNIFFYSNRDFDNIITLTIVMGLGFLFNCFILQFGTFILMCYVLLFTSCPCVFLAFFIAILVSPISLPSLVLYLILPVFPELYPCLNLVF